MASDTPLPTAAGEAVAHAVVSVHEAPGAGAAVLVLPTEAEGATVVPAEAVVGRTVSVRLLVAPGAMEPE
jgi:hypothetical protein